MLKYNDLTEEFQEMAKVALVENIFHNSQFLRCSDKSIEDIVLVSSKDVLTSSNLSGINIAGWLNNSNCNNSFMRVSGNIIDSILTEHPAKRYARTENMVVLLAPVNMFSDEILGNVSKSPIIFKNLSFSFGNLPFKSRSITSNSYIPSSANK
jgi:hypothetical protein